MGQIHGTLLRDFLVLFQKLDGMPAVVDHVRIFLLQNFNDGIDFVFNQIAVHHNKFFVMVMTMSADISMVMLKLVRPFGILVMRCRVDQNIQTAALSCRNRDHRDPQHFRKSMNVDFHAALFHDIHHVQCHDDRFPQLQQLQCQV